MTAARFYLDMHRIIPANNLIFNWIMRNVPEGGDVSGKGTVLTGIMPDNGFSLQMTLGKNHTHAFRLSTAFKYASDSFR